MTEIRIIHLLSEILKTSPPDKVYSWLYLFKNDVEKSTPLIQQILDECCMRYGVTPNSNGSTPQDGKFRKMAAYLLKTECDLSQRDIARYLMRSKTQVRQYLETMETISRLRNVEPELHDDLISLQQKIQNLKK